MCVCVRERGQGRERTPRAPAIRQRFDGGRLETIWRGDEFNTNSSQRRSRRPTPHAPAHLPGKYRPLARPTPSYPACLAVTQDPLPPLTPRCHVLPTLEVSVFVCTRNVMFKSGDLGVWEEVEETRWESIIRRTESDSRWRRREVEFHAG